MIPVEVIVLAMVLSILVVIISANVVLTYYSDYDFQYDLRYRNARIRAIVFLIFGILLIFGLLFLNRSDLVMH